MIGASPSPSPSPSASSSAGYAKTSNGSFGGVPSGGGGTASTTRAIPGKNRVYLGAGNDVAKQYSPNGWPSYITVGGVDENGPLGGMEGGWYTKEKAENQAWLADPNSGSFKRLNYYYSQLPADAKKKWKSQQSYWKWAVGLVSGPQASPNGVWQTPWDVMGEIAEMSPELRNSLFKKTGGGGSGSGAMSLAGTYTSSSVDLTNEKDARLLINNVYQQLLGRDANDAEAKNYLRNLNKAEKAAPVKTTTTTDARGRVVRQSRSGGTNSQQLGIEDAEANKEFKTYQSETTYYDAFMNALGTPPQGA